LRIRKGSHP